jgi:hypothetical protein
MRAVHLTCDECGAETVVEGYGWPGGGWYHWHQRDLCRDCALPLILSALRDCAGEADSPAPIGP